MNDNVDKSDLDKLAAELRNIKPSKGARARGMDAAMAAFDAEFETAADKNFETAQGLAARPRPTRQTVRNGRALTFGGSVMDKLSKFFEYTPKKAMMGGSALAAIMAAMIFIPAINIDTGPDVNSVAVPAPVIEMTDAEVSPKPSTEVEVPVPAEPETPALGMSEPVASEPVASETLTPEPVAPEPITSEPTLSAKSPSVETPSIVTRQAEPVSPDVPAIAEEDVTSVDSLLSEAETGAYTSGVTSMSGPSSAPMSAPMPAPPPPTVHAEVDEVVVTGAMKMSGARARSDAGAVAAADVGTYLRGEAGVEATDVEGSFMDAAIPAMTKTISRRVLKSPARTEERTIPAITKMETRRIQNPDGSFDTVMETVVVQEAGTELVTIPATYETVTEVVRVDAEGNILPDAPIEPPKPRPQSGQLTAGDYDDVLNPDLYKIYLDKMLQGPLKGKDLPYVDANKRINIRVLDTLGQPVPLADIRLTSPQGTRMFPLRTGADGMAYLYPGFDNLKSGTTVRVSAKGGRAVKKKLSQKLVRSGGDFVIDLRLDAAPVQKLDLLLTMDATGSMGDEMRYLQSELKAIVGRVEAAHPGVDIRTGLVVYRDKGDDYVVREVPFTDDIEAFRVSLAKQNADGGGDFPEAMHSAMEAGLDMDWRDDAVKVNLLVADAPPHDKNIDETWEAGLISRTEGIHIVPLAASGVDKSAEFLMRAMAQITGGRFLFLTDDSGIGNPHAEPTVDCYVVTRLDGLVTRVLSSLLTGERVEPESGDVIRSVGNYRAGTCAVDAPKQYVLPEKVTYPE